MRRLLTYWKFVNYRKQWFDSIKNYIIYVWIST